MGKILRPPALTAHSTIAIVSPGSPAEAERVARGTGELARLGYKSALLTCEPESYFAGSVDNRRFQLLEALQSEEFEAVICTRGGYGSNYLLDDLDVSLKGNPRVFVGYSDITTLQIFLWKKLRWVTFYGPMAAAGLDGGAGKPAGYDENSFTRAITDPRSGWTLELSGETLIAGRTEGVLLGGCMTLVEASLGTPWELDTAGSILILEDRAMKAYQVDRVLTHLRQAGKLKGVKGIILGDFPESGAAERSPTVRDVCHRILNELRIPVVWGAPIGHTSRPVLTVPLGVSARLHAEGRGKLEILEPGVTL